MKIQEAVETCLTRKYADFDGEATRSELWWFFLFVFLVSLLLQPASHLLSLLFSLAMLVPTWAVGARRLHDTGRSGWWQLISLVPLVGFIVLIVFYAQRGRLSPTPAV